ncbi:MAG: ABC transporter permease [Propioniciclava sp.]
MLTPIAAFAAKNLRSTLRAPLFAVVAVIVPVAFTALYAVVVSVSTTAPVAVALEDTSPEAVAFVDTMRGLRNADGPLYEIRTTDPDQARAWYADGSVGALVTIPDGFGAAVSAGRPAPVEVRVVSINADGVKNQHLRLEAAVRAFEHAHTDPSGHLAVTESTVLDHDIGIRDYLGTALLIFAALYAGIVGAGTSVAREFEGRTITALVLSPSGAPAFVAGTWAAITLTSVVTLSAAVLAVGLTLGIDLTRIGPVGLAALVVSWSYGVGWGLTLGTLLRRSLPLVPLAVLIAVAHFLVCGYESYLRGFAQGGAIEILWRATAWIPLSGVIDAARFELAGLAAPPGSMAAFGWTVGLTVVLAAAASLLLTRRAQLITHGQ